ncbi:hypothetical protein DXG03_004837 [Asterophora parasitica]|uniref:Uncharacterized protein n=1 Tax=Asterophora parasitica TaxID=117018 RepID=A0A9P7FVZ4_9AGAR|nr:hypothetical protein DXG03_004837 [Asterophora parasitica]
MARNALASHWSPLLLCPNLRTLSVVYLHGTIRPPPSLAECPFYFQHLEHLTICGAGDIEFPRFAVWLASFASLSKLTHFKFSTHHGVHDNAVLLLLQILANRHASLQVLVFERLADGTCNTLHHIARMFPDLVALTLVYRASHRQAVNKPAAWQYRAWTYAAHLAGLTHLQYFAWNNDEGGLIPSSAVLRRFGEGFCAASERGSPMWTTSWATGDGQR